MTYIKYADDLMVYPYSLSQLRLDNPNTSFPAEMPDKLLASCMVYPVVSAPEPSYDPTTQVAKLDTFPTQASGVWSLKWEVRDKTPTELAAEQVAQAALRIAELKAFLRDTDYVALRDYDKDKPEVIAERQAAREELRELGA
jgi:hypothetical protein